MRYINYGILTHKILKFAQNLIYNYHNMNLEKIEFRDNITKALKSIKKYQTPNTKKAIVQIINSFGPFLLVWILMYNLWENYKWIVFILGVLNALFLVRIFIIQHDCGHNSFLKSRWWRHSVGYVCSLFSFIKTSLSWLTS